MNATTAERSEIMSRKMQGQTHKEIAAAMGIHWRRSSYIYQEEIRRQKEEAEGVVNVVPPPCVWPHRPLRLSATFKANAERATRDQKPMKAMATNPAPEWVD